MEKLLLIMLIVATINLNAEIKKIYRDGKLYEEL